MGLGIAENIREIIGEISETAQKASRNPSDIKIVAVTKTVPADRIIEAVDAGLTILGENRVQELTSKFEHIKGVEWHLIGHLQSNKVKYIVDKVTLIHSVDSVSLAQEISKRMAALNRVMDILIQVNIADESTKFGATRDNTIGLIREVSKLPGLRIKGLMTIGPYTYDPEEVRPVFRSLRELAEELKTMDFPGIEMKHLSMGMSNDYKIAIEEGATLIRLGSVIFGRRT